MDLDWNDEDTEEIDKLCDEFINQEMVEPTNAENNNLDQIPESEATVLLSLHLDLLNKNSQKDKRWEV